jgi:acyl carrier protein
MPQTITSTEIRARVFSVLEEFGAEPDQLAGHATFEALDVDSLDLVELAQIVQDEYGVELKGEDMPALKTVDDAVNMIVSRL